VGKVTRTFPALISVALLMAPACLRAEADEAWIQPLPQFEPGASVLVIAAVDDVFRVQRIGETIFGNKTREYPVPDWQLAEPLERRTTENLARMATLQVRPLEDAAMRANFRGFQIERLAKRADRRRMRDVVVEAGKRAGTEYVVVIAADQPVRDPFFNTAVSTPPFGVVQDDRPFRPDAVLQAHLVLLIFDARNGEQLSFAEQTHNAPRALLPKSVELGVEEVGELQGDVLDLFRLAVAISLRDMYELRQQRR
jgi:hypothetical protein